MKSPLPVEPRRVGRTHQSRVPFGFSSVEGWEEIVGQVPAQVYPVATELFQQGAPAQAVYLIKQGLVKLMRLEEQGQPAIVGLRSSGWLLGAAAVILQSPYATTAETLTCCHIRRIPATIFHHLVKTNIQFSWQLHQMHSREVYDRVAQLTELGCLPARLRLEQFLWDLISVLEPIESPKPVRLSVPLKHWELAQMIAVTPEHLSRVLKELEQDGILQRGKGVLILSDPQRLWHRAEV